MTLPSVRTLVASTLALLAGCSNPNAPSGAHDDVVESQTAAGDAKPAIIGGTPATNPAIGQLTKYTGTVICTATLVGPQAVLTSADCVGGSDTQGLVFTGGDSFIAGGVSYRFDKMHVFGDHGAQLLSTATPDGVAGTNTDVALVHLTSAPPIAPMAISTVPPLPGATVTGFGYGCNATSGSGSGTLRDSSWTFGGTPFQPCGIDEGGPVILGSATGGGAIWGVTSVPGGAVTFGDVSYYAEEILQQMRAWDGLDYNAGFDRFGGDYTALTATGPSVCENDCRSDPACRAWTFSASRRTCWLKSIAGPASPATADLSSGINLQQQPNYDRPGNDYLGGSTPLNMQIEKCMQGCARNPACLAYSWIPAGVKSANPWCYLKTALGTAVPDSGVITGVARNFEPNTNRPGYDYAWPQAASAADCQGACAQQGQCRAYTYVSSTHTCWLKSAAAPPVVSSSDNTSGVKRGLDLNVDRAGSDMPGSPIHLVAPNATPESCQAECLGSFPECAAWAFVPAGVQGTDPLCYLKSDVPAPSSADGIVSGVQGLEFF